MLHEPIPNLKKLVEPDRVLIGGADVAGIGNLMVRWRGPTLAAFGDHVQATGKLSLPRDLPTFDRRAYLAQRRVYLELATTGLNVVGAGAGLEGLPGWLRSHYTAALDQALPAPHAAVIRDRHRHEPLSDRGAPDLVGRALSTQ